jgi:hypothetical protein
VRHRGRNYNQVLEDEDGYDEDLPKGIRETVMHKGKVIWDPYLNREFPYSAFEEFDSQNFIKLYAENLMEAED